MIAPQFYYPFFLTLTLVMVLVSGTRYWTMQYPALMRPRPKQWYISIALAIFITFFLGLRYPFTRFFADSAGYAVEFIVSKANPWHYLWGYGGTGREGEWGWGFLRETCKLCGLSYTLYFIVVAAIYVGFTLLTARKISRDNTLIAFLFLISTFSFYSYGVNGLRNGLGAAIVLYGIIMWPGDKRQKIIAAAICLIGLSFHKSMLLPIVAMVAAYYFIDTIPKAMAVWFIAILLSLFASSFTESFFSGFNYDERFADYVQSGMDARHMTRSFSHTGFRWDFLLYSCVPIVLGMYIRWKRNIRSRYFAFLLNTYILSNAFWIMVIRSSFSNRFAYLSWFMYGAVLAYPLLRLKVAQHQGQWVMLFLLGQIGFNLLMYFIKGNF